APAYAVSATPTRRALYCYRRHSVLQYAIFSAQFGRVGVLRRLDAAVQRPYLTQISFWISRDRLIIERQRDEHVRAFAARATDLQFSAHLFDALAHSGQTKAIMSIFDFESVAVVAKFEAKFFCLEGQPGFKIAWVRVFESVGQRFLPDMEEIFLPYQRQMANFAT